MSNRKTVLPIIWFISCGSIEQSLDKTIRARARASDEPRSWNHLWDKSGAVTNLATQDQLAYWLLLGLRPTCHDHVRLAISDLDEVVADAVKAAKLAIMTSKAREDANVYHSLLSFSLQAQQAAVPPGDGQGENLNV